VTHGSMYCIQAGWYIIENRPLGLREVYRQIACQISPSATVVTYGAVTLRRRKVDQNHTF